MLGLVKIAGGKMRLGKPGNRAAMGRVLFQHLAEGLCGGCHVALVHGVGSHGEHFFDRRRCQIIIQMPRHKLLDLAFGQRAHKAVDRAAIFERENRRNRLNLQLLGDGGMLVNIHLRQTHRAIGLRGDLLEQWRQLLARPAPWGP